MRTVSKLILGLILAVALLSYSSCKKADFSTSSGKENLTSIEEKFFNTHRSANATEKMLIEFLKKINNKEKFVEQTAYQIGYPRWDKVLASAKKKINQHSQNLLSDSVQTFYIPFVRDSQNFVNASMIIRTSPSDTSISYRCDWQYAEMDNDVNSANDPAEHFAAFFMQLDNAVFGYNKFNIVDSNLFRTTHGPAKYITLDYTDSSNTNNFDIVEICQDVVYVYQNCTYGGSTECSEGCDQCYLCMDSFVITYCWEEYIDTGGGGGGGTGGGTSGGGEGGGTGGGGGSTPPDCRNSPPPVSEPFAGGSNQNIVPICGGGWTPMPIEDEPVNVDVTSSPHAPEYPDISDGEPQVSLQSLFNCFAQIPDAGATYSVKLCVDLPVNGMWNAPFNLTHKSPGHTFLTLTKTNGTQTISQSVGFYPIGSGGNPGNPTATGGFKNNGLPNHEYNAAINAYNVSATQFALVMNNLLNHENDTYNIFDNNCTTIALNAFNLIITPRITIEPFTVQMPINPPQVPYYFMQSPQKLYKAIGSFQAGYGLIKEYNINYDSPLSTNVCP